MVHHSDQQLLINHESHPFSSDGIPQFMHIKGFGSVLYMHVSCTVRTEPAFRFPYRKKSQDEKSGDVGGHGTSTNIGFSTKYRSSPPIITSYRTSSKNVRLPSVTLYAKITSRAAWRRSGYTHFVASHLHGWGSIPASGLCVSSFPWFPPAMATGLLWPRTGSKRIREIIIYILHQF